MNKSRIFSVILLSAFIGFASGQQAFGYGGPPEQSSSGKYTVTIYSDRESYNLGESITFSGNVSKYSEDRNLRISVYDGAKNLIVTQKTPVDADTLFTHEIPLDERFSDGKYVVRAQYGSTKITVQQMTFLIGSEKIVSLDKESPEEIGIPEWVKSNAGWWAEGAIDDNSFVQGIQFMIKEGLMRVPLTEQGSESQNNEIPEWVKSNAGWWAEGAIDDNSFVQGIQFMIKEGLMRVSQ